MLLWRWISDSVPVCLSHHYIVTSSPCRFPVYVFYYLKESQEKPFRFWFLFFVFILYFLFFFPLVIWNSWVHWNSVIPSPIPQGDSGLGNMWQIFLFFTQFPSEREYTCKGSFFVFVVVVVLVFFFNLCCFGLAGCCNGAASTRPERKGDAGRQSVCCAEGLSLRLLWRSTSWQMHTYCGAQDSVSVKTLLLCISSLSAGFHEARGGGGSRQTSHISVLVTSLPVLY